MSSRSRTSISQYKSMEHGEAKNELVNSRSNKDGSPQNVNVRRKKSLGVDDGAKHAMNELTNKILPGSAHAQTSKKLFEADDGQNLEVKELTGETLPATTYVKAAKKVKAEPQAGSAKPAELRIITSPPQTFEASAQSNKTYTTEPCITPTPHSHSCGSRAPIAITYNHHYHDHHRHLNYFAEEPSNDAPWPFTPMVNKTQVTGCVRVGICASDRAFNTLPLPRRWTAQHDRALCYLEVAGYPSNTFEYHLRTAFPELVGLLPQKTLENRVRTLDQNYEIPYFGEAFKLVHTDTSRHMYDTVLVPSPFSVAAMRGEVYKEPRVRGSYASLKDTPVATPRIPTSRPRPEMSKNSYASLRDIPASTPKTRLSRGRLRNERPKAMWFEE